MKDRRDGTKVHTHVTAEDPRSLFPLQEALGYNLAQSLFGQERNLVCEGLTDYWYLDGTASLIRDTVELNDKIAIVPANNAAKVVYFAAILHAQDLKVAALLDSDQAGEDAAQQDNLVGLLGSRGVIRTKDHYVGPVTKPEIEDLLRPTLIAIGKTIGWDVEAKAKTQSTRTISEIFEELSGFSKYKLAKEYLKWASSHEAKDLSADEQNQWKSLIDTVNKALK